MREFVRSLVLNFMPAKIAHRINVAKNLHASYLEPEMAALDALVSEGNAIDVGANLGLYCELLADRWPKVLAIEPQPNLVKYLRKIIPPNVQLLELAASDTVGNHALRIPSTKFYSQDALATLEPYAHDKPGATVTIRTDLLDNIIPPEFRPISFIKIDVEGHEGKTIAGAQGIIREDRPALLVEIFRDHNPRAADIFNMMNSLGYTALCQSKDDKTSFALASALDLYRPNIVNFIFVCDQRLDALLIPGILAPNQSRFSKMAQ
jgi:FkbM family methyltransferase